MNYIFLISLFSFFQDNLIHASIRKSFVNHFSDIQEGKIYQIKYFGVVENKDAYRTLTGNFDYTFILKIYLYTIIFITHCFD